ncbi:hypothetical protein J1605_017905 [Eschrichtius robustus]|uniref:Uncharacterized protein n=1 Tax=Eschrichtius robustus TaxID=9764 RepID=A0AB34HZ48_ESCRO|nr:hypothetical protein J1605_017905 [Eschrichtius robustus]
MKTDHLELKVMGRSGQKKSELERALDRSADPALTGCPEPCYRKLSRVPSVVPCAALSARGASIRPKAKVQRAPNPFPERLWGRSREASGVRIVSTFPGWRRSGGRGGRGSLGHTRPLPEPRACCAPARRFPEPRQSPVPPTQVPPASGHSLVYSHSNSQADSFEHTPRPVSSAPCSPPSAPPSSSLGGSQDEPDKTRFCGARMRRVERRKPSPVAPRTPLRAALGGGAGRTLEAVQEAKPSQALEGARGRLHWAGERGRGGALVLGRETQESSELPGPVWESWLEMGPPNSASSQAAPLHSVR